MAKSDFLRCETCRTLFVRPGKRGPIPKFCADCAKKRTNAGRKEYHRAYYREVTRNSPEQMENRRRHRRIYNQRPEVKEKYRQRFHDDPEYRERHAQRQRESGYFKRPEVRARINAQRRERYATDPEYRDRAIANASRRVRVPQEPIPAPYSGHRWLEMAKNVVAPNLDHTSAWADQYHDDMGEAVLALLEGRDPKEAVKEYRRKEFVPRHLTQHMSDYKNEDGDSWFDVVLPKEESAEDQAITNETINTLVKAKWGKPSQKRASRHMDTGHTSQPTNRRANRKGLADHRRGAFVRP